MKLLHLLFSASAALALSAAAHAAEESATAPIARPVVSQIVEHAHATNAQFVGVVAPRVSASIAFRIGGNLVTRQVDVGAQVLEGQTLASLDATTYQLALQTARANLASADAQYANAAAAEGRLRTLNQSDVVSLANLEQAEQQTSGAQASLVQAQARLRQAQEQLSYATISAPFTGIVTSVGAEAGSVVAAGQSIVTLADPTTRDVVIDLPEAIIGAVQIGSAFRISPQLSPDIEVTGTVREIAPQANPLTRAWRVKIGIDEQVQDFWLGSTANAILGAAAQSALIIPMSAIKTENEKTSVFVVDAATATVRAREVTLDLASAGPDRAVVTEGLQAGERVVIAGVNTLQDGQVIALSEESSK